jgi:hypothetical protein
MLSRREMGNEHRGKGVGGMHGAKPYEDATPPPYFCLLEPYARLQKNIRYLLLDHHQVLADDALEAGLKLSLCRLIIFSIFFGTNLQVNLYVIRQIHEFFHRCTYAHRSGLAYWSELLL